MENNRSTLRSNPARIELPAAVKEALLDRAIMPHLIHVRGTEYRIQDCGRDGFKSVVWKASDDIGRERALKFAVLDDYRERSYLQELNRAARLDGYSEFASYSGADFVDIDLGKIGRHTFVCFVEEWVEGETLDQYLEQHGEMITPSFLKAYIGLMCNALNILRTLELKHDDLHSKNVMIVPPRPGDLSRRFRVKIIDTGSLKPLDQSNAKPKDDLHNFVDHIILIWNAIHGRRLLSIRDRRFLDSVQVLVNSMLDDDPSTQLSDPAQITSACEAAYDRTLSPSIDSGVRLLNPFEFISAEHMADDRLLVEIFASSVPWFDKVAGPDPCLVTGPRGCGKSTIFRWLSLKAHLHESASEIDRLRVVGFYISCSADLQNRIGWINTEALAARFAPEIVHYFNLLIAREMIHTLASISRRADRVDYFSFGEPQELRVYDFCVAALSLSTRPLMQGVSRLEQIAEAIETDLVNVHTKMLRGSSIEDPTPQTFLSDFSALLSSQTSFFTNKKIAFLIDDFSVHRLPEQVQRILNRIIWIRQPSHVFKLSSEKMGCTLMDPQLVSSELTREMIEIDCGREFIALEDNSHNAQSRKFAIDLLNHRLRAAGFQGTAETLIGKSPRGSLAQSLASQRGRTPHYCGTERISSLCSGDVSTLLLVYRRIFEEGRVTRTSSAQVHQSVQDRCVREVARELLQAIKSYFPNGPEMYDVISSFGTLVKNILLHGAMQKEGDKRVPSQCPRIEIDQTSKGITDRLTSDQQKIADELLRRAIFIDMGPGLSRHAGVTTMRWHLRRIYLPAFGAALSKNNAIKPGPKDWFRYFLTDPKGACEMIWQVWPKKSPVAAKSLEPTLFEGH